MDFTQQLQLKNVRYEKKDRLAYVTLNRPEKLNALTEETLWDLYRCWDNFAGDDGLWVAILSGEGRSFCAGFDLVSQPELLETGTSVRPHGVLYGDMDCWNKPIIAAVQGYAVGGGMTLALGADVRICADDAKMGYPQPRTGFMSVGGPLRLPEVIPGLARWYLLSGEIIDAQEAYRLGMVVKVVSRDRLMAEAEKLAQKILECSPVSVRHTKEAIAAGASVPMYEGYRFARHIANRFFKSQDWEEAVKAFREKRRPVWKNR